MVDIDVTMAWDDNNNEKSRRPETISVILKANGTEVGTYDLKESENWTHTFSDLLKYDTNNNEIVYTVEQVLESDFYSETTNEKVTDLLAEDTCHPY